MQARLHLVFRVFSCYIFLMSFTQTVEIPANHRLTIDVPPEVPVGQAKIRFFPVSAGKERMSETQEIELINRNAERLNAEAMDVLSYQNMYLDL
jgi:hypothetical protein